MAQQNTYTTTRQKTYSFGSEHAPPAAQRGPREQPAPREQHRAPIKSFRSGAIQVAIWENEATGRDGQQGTYNTVSFERRYKDPKSGDWKSTNQLRINDLPKAALILSKAYEYLVLAAGSDEEE